MLFIGVVFVCQEIAWIYAFNNKVFAPHFWTKYKKNTQRVSQKEKNGFDYSQFLSELILYLNIQQLDKVANSVEMCGSDISRY